MSSITFASGTVVPASWLNDVNNAIYNVLSAGTNTVLVPWLAPNGSVTAPAYAFSAQTNLGFYKVTTQQIALAAGAGISALSLGTTNNSTGFGGIQLTNSGGLTWSASGDTTATSDLELMRDGAGILAQRRLTAAQEFRIYGTATGPKYLSAKHDGTNAILDTSAASGAVNIGLTNATSVNVKNLGGATPDTGAFTTASTTGLLTANSATVTNTLTANALIDASGASAGQIKFPAAQNASANVNTLDDYEEGTWTPSVGGTATYLSQFGEYVKIGHTVYIWGSMQINVIGTGSTNQISGLPFTCVPTNNHNTFISLECTNASAVSLVSNSALINNNTTTINLMGRTAAATSATTQNMMGNSTTLIFSGQYLVAN